MTEIHVEMIIAKSKTIRLSVEILTFSQNTALALFKEAINLFLC